MDMKKLLQKPIYLVIMKTIGESMRTRSKMEQQEKAKNYSILNKNAIKGQILFTGSSLMEQFPITEIARNHGVEKMIYNRGIGGYTTDDFLENIDTVLFDLEPSKLFINIGTNDINGSENWDGHLLENYEEILKQLKAKLPDCVVYMMAYYPVNPTIVDNAIMASMLKARSTENLLMINEKVKELADKYGYNYIDANDGLCDENGYQKAELSKEGIHMYASAYEIVFENIKEYI